MKGFGEMKITQKMVRAVKAHARNTHHDEKWWEFENRQETTAIQAALNAAHPEATIGEIAADAQRCLDLIRDAANEGEKKNPAAIVLGRMGGAARSEAKAAAARENGRKGGRPRKETKKGGAK